MTEIQWSKNWVAKFWREMKHKIKSKKEIYKDK